MCHFLNLRLRRVPKEPNRRILAEPIVTRAVLRRVWAERSKGRPIARRPPLLEGQPSHPKHARDFSDDARGPERDYRAKRNGTFTINRYSVAQKRPTESSHRPFRKQPRDPTEEGEFPVRT